MWDVKSIDLEEGMAQYEFYLNYVGCKVKNRIMSNKIKRSFTLTMWDVKEVVKWNGNTKIEVLP